jgi:hypothetical protein
MNKMVYVLLILIVISGLVVLAIWKWGGIKKKQEIDLDKLNIGELSLSPAPDSADSENNGNLNHLYGKVLIWDSGSGKLTITNGEQQWSMSLEPSKMRILIPSRVEARRELLVADKEGPRWLRAFCEGDEVDIQFENNAIVAVNNGGYRVCGYKGE